MMEHSCFKGSLRSIVSHAHSTLVQAMLKREERVPLSCFIYIFSLLVSTCLLKSFQKTPQLACQTNKLHTHAYTLTEISTLGRFHNILYSEM